MINLDTELERLRRSLDIKGLDFDDVEQIVGLAKQDVDNTIDQLVADAIQQATLIGVSKDALDFIAELEVKDYGGQIQIGTMSGKTDFSLPPYPNLNNLLKNAKVAEDGSRYKVIPIGKKSERTYSPGNMSDLALLQQQMNEQRQIERDARKSMLDDARKATFTGQSANILSGLAKAREILQQKKSEEQRVERESEPQDYRTASSKQDPTTDWVLPEVERDMTGALNEINKQLESNINHAVASIINEYERLV